LEAVTSEGQVGAIIRGKWQGFGVQTFQGSTCIQGFSVTGPDAQGYIRLVAMDANGQQGEILRSKLVGVGFQSYTLAGEVVKGFQASGPDAQGYVYLSVITVPVGTQVGEDLGDQTENPQNPVVLQLAAVYYHQGSPIFSLRIPKDERVVMKVYSPLGRLVFWKELQTQRTNHTVALPHLPRGLYFVHFEGKTAIIQKRVLVLR
ncbi:MAG: T9SS type A sorting domain-containing protein, partial [Candidatus Hydrothermae bacterium]|nr:T9SS type A sorting domain-containing protein [Candidatus Hydrothermae bacterium]